MLTYSPEISRCVDNKTLFEPIEYKKVTYACQTETLPNLDQQMQNFGKAGALPRLLLQKSPFPARQCVPAQSHPTICLPAIPFLDSFPLSSWIEMLINRNERFERRTRRESRLQERFGRTPHRIPGRFEQSSVHSERWLAFLHWRRGAGPAGFNRSETLARTNKVIAAFLGFCFGSELVR